MSEPNFDDQSRSIPIQDSRIDAASNGPVDQTHHQSPLAARPQPGGRRKFGKEHREHQPNPWHEIQSLRRKLTEHEETIGKLKAAFGMIAVALDVQRPATPPQAYPFVFNGSGNAARGSSIHEMPANRPPRLLRRGGFNNANNRDASSGNSVYYKNNNKGNRRQFDVEYRSDDTPAF